MFVIFMLFNMKIDTKCIMCNNKVRRFIQHEVGDGNHDRPWLDLRAVHLAFDAMRKMKDIQTGKQKG